MVERDPAFLWETEALRSASRQGQPGPGGQPVNRDDPDWHTLRRASEVTKIPVPTIRKWALGGNVPSFLEKTAAGPLRMVSLRGVYQRAGELGRDVHGKPPRREETPSPQAKPPPGGSDTREPGAGIPPGTMLVPLDAWNKMVNQLGNLHEAGQQLAEARERAAKAETEVRFLKERLAEMRTGQPGAGDSPGLSTAAVTDEPPSSAVAALGRLYSKWRRRRRSTEG